ncbi:hypothetical protein ACPBEH_03440 [Latilactobacillus sp. 5-91]|uniref:hypothetical protein n=1 Tax=Latilactobacillus sp. 5-91 TaxID=3410924 RepID=UPI003C77E0AB
MENIIFVLVAFLFWAIACYANTFYVCYRLRNHTDNLERENKRLNDDLQDYKSKLSKHEDVITDLRSSLQAQTTTKANKFDSWVTQLSGDFKLVPDNISQNVSIEKNDNLNKSSTLAKNKSKSQIQELPQTPNLNQVT